MCCECRGEKCECQQPCRLYSFMTSPIVPLDVPSCKSCRPASAVSVLYRSRALLPTADTPLLQQPPILSLSRDDN
jgi:hypothetical protein